MTINLAQSAVSYALKGNWDKAIIINQKILQEDQADVDALNRLAKAYVELGKITKARSCAKKVLRIDPFNTIATKSVNKWKNYKATSSKNSNSDSAGPSSAQVFLEEPGRTKIISLLHLGNPKVIANVDAGDCVKLSTNSHRVSICSSNGSYIGRLSDDLSAHLKKLISLGNEYSVFIKSVEPKNVRVFIRETKRSKKLSNINSFSSEKIDYVSFTPP